MRDYFIKKKKNQPYSFVLEALFKLWYWEWLKNAYMQKSGLLFLQQGGHNLHTGNINM